VVAIAAEAAKRPERVVDAPTPECMLHEMGDSSLNFILNFWIKDAEQGVMNIRGEVLLALWDAFKENNILIPYPHREVYLHHVEKSGN
ncbi:MAG: mechanosensitive ion channel family protein, partial [Alphaproteobacteria bacterium]